MIRKRKSVSSEKITGIVGGTAVVVLGLILISAPLVVWSIRKQDTTGAETRTGRATVTGITYRQVKETNLRPSALINLDLNGDKVPVNTLSPPRIGESVRIEYKVGKSGQIYVERILAQ